MNNLVNHNVCFVTWVTHNSRVSERMVQVLPEEFIEDMKPYILTYAQQVRVAKVIAASTERYGFKTLTFNVLPDHVHLVLIIKDVEQFPTVVGNAFG